MKIAVSLRFALGAVVLSLAACGESPEQVAVDLCEQGLKERLGEQSFTVDKAAMLKGVSRPAGSDIAEISATATLESGPLNFLCRLQYDAQNPKAPPTVIYVQTN